ncbi:hypothetical protein T10_10040 [Trichinella papuae]|uniref:Uncharacterized protein n=1 Tax=Trichinella papuae TaxID=268474 RepID=A0A0V1MRP6_9BILA|nr:hypothetical protein T10_10040 [Trichinella papuae]
MENLCPKQVGKFSKPFILSCPTKKTRHIRHGHKMCCDINHHLVAAIEVYLKVKWLHYHFNISCIDDYRFNGKYCLIFSNCGHCMPNTGLNVNK